MHRDTALFHLLKRLPNDTLALQLAAIQTRKLLARAAGVNFPCPLPNYMQGQSSGVSASDRRRKEPLWYLFCPPFSRLLPFVVVTAMESALDVGWSLAGGDQSRPSLIVLS